MRNDNISTAATRPDRIAEIDAQALDFDQRVPSCAPAPRYVDREYHASVAERFRPSTVRKMARQGKTESHGDVVIW